MPTKTFTARNWQEALLMVKAELGEGAVILTSAARAARPGQSEQVEVTASNEADAVARGKPAAGGTARQLAKVYGKSQPAPIRPGDGGALERELGELKELVRGLSLRSDLAQSRDFAPPLRALAAHMQMQGFSPERTGQVCSLVGRAANEAEAMAGAVEAMATLIQCGGPIKTTVAQCRVVALVGPTGVGKTTTLSKLAANFKVSAKSRIGVITVDTYRLGATEQLRTLGGILEVPVRIVMTPGEIQAALRELRECDLLFIDTAGRSPKDAMRMNELRAFMLAAQPDETHFVFPATHHPRQVHAAIEKFGTGVSRLVLTKLDEAAALGPALDIVLGAGKPLSYVTTGQNIPGDIELADSHRLARLMLGLDELSVGHPV